MNSERKKAVEYARRFLGTPYSWGGESPIIALKTIKGTLRQIGGFDCSGFVRWIGKASGWIPFKGDQTSQMLFNRFQNKEIKVQFRGPGCLAFYGRSKSKITHIAMFVDHNRIIEAGGGGSKTKTVEDAQRTGACVREMYFGHRRDLVAICDPFAENP